MEDKERAEIVTYMGRRQWYREMFGGKICKKEKT
jgi:hypothetical protein